MNDNFECSHEPHCEECGASGADLEASTGYTACCGEFVCDGEGFHSYEDNHGKTWCCYGFYEASRWRFKR